MSRRGRRASRRTRGGLRALLRWSGRLLYLASGLSLAALAAALAWLVVAQPQYVGADRLAGLGGEVRVLRDGHGVPHIFARGLTDAYRALGYVHAQDRLVQMEFNRRLGAGRMAELFGAVALPADRLMRTLGLYRLAELQAAALPAEERAALEAYAGGVNAYLASPQRALPPELLLLEGAPEPWRPADSLVWAKLMALQLAGNWRGELVRERARGRLSPEQVADLWPDENGGRAVTLGARAPLDDGVLARQAALLDRVVAVADASNEWVLAGRHTASGKPILANDPHLGFSAPGLWYLARIVTPELELAGATVAGVPFHILGHNGRLAWGMTTTHGDTQDLFVEKLALPDRGSYLAPDGPRPFAIRTETIRVRFRADPEVLTVRSTRHGPVVSDLDDGAGRAGDTAMALAFTALAEDDRTPSALYRMNRARTADEFRAALADFHAPQQNIAFAATDGAIGFVAAGRAPIRGAGDGTVPARGEVSDFDWRGTIPFADLPQAIDPPSGRIVNANNRVVDNGYPFLLARDWPDGFRADRILALLDEPGAMTVERTTAMQQDNLATEAPSILPRLLALAGAGDAPRARRALDMLAHWDFRMDRARPEPLLYVAWLGETWRRIVGDELGDLYGALAEPRPAALARMLGERGAWCDDTRTAIAEDCAGQVRAALTDALALVERRLGADFERWRWGDLHQARFRNLALGRLPLVGPLFDILAATDGGAQSINRGVPVPDGPNRFEDVHGPGLRAVYDLADLANSRFMIATGQSDRPFAPHYDDLTPRWTAGEYLALAGTAEELAGRGAHELRLAP